MLLREILFAEMSRPAGVLNEDDDAFSVVRDEGRTQEEANSSVQVGATLIPGNMRNYIFLHCSQCSEKPRT